MAEELNEQSTTEEVDSYVETLVKETVEDRAGTETQSDKGDARIVNEHADNVKTEPAAEADEETPAAEEDSGDENAEQSAQADESWLDDDLKAEAAAYGIEESEIADFASREELERALRLFDKTALEAGRKAMAEGEQEEEPARDDKGKFSKKEEVPVKEGQYEVTLDKDVYDEDIVGEFGRMRDHYESQLSALRSEVGEVLQFARDQAEQAEEQHFDGLVESLGHADLFGKAGKENTKQLERRNDLYVAVKAQQIGLEQLGRPTELNESLVSRVAKMVFAEDLGKKALKDKTRKIQKQSNGRQGGGATRPQDPREDPAAFFDRRYKELEGAS